MALHVLTEVVGSQAENWAESTIFAALMSCTCLMPHPEALLEPLSPEELASWESSSLPTLDHSHDGQHGLTAR